MGSSVNALVAALLLAAFPLCSKGFSLNGGLSDSPSQSCTTACIVRWNRFRVEPMIRTRASSFRLFASTESASDESALSEGNKAALRSIEKEMEKYNRKREKALETLSKYEEGIQVLKKKKTDYLEGIKLGKTPEGGNFSETTIRSAVKAMLWRVIAGLVTFITSLRFSGSLKTALSIVGSDFFSKALTMFIGERLMNQSQAGRKSGADDVGRSLAKALIWRAFAICNTLTMSLLFAKDLSIASKIAGSDAIFKTGLMFVYERVWARIEWGKEYQIEFAI
mmetsp:Transcript_49104/g.90956  ORF Transcript_49104/g.90956 Transcript_49104/m.90956 type:complete len:280 (-) Transcript_49104:153-992(-)|eukprot:CAMPEP_0197452124 /NCGR_PEP_ID=MMETSP1175-20131217/31185_1 /TAXON_ID=1003142 /ORGANISM="Triceratium dubium, Strain CCMP147" /LENGTH=279 /DNA_ID=CAMNT_0042985047 /DNA_START=42 /DNA_END=881 /DNA_ORIENTATION=+